MGPLEDAGLSLVQMAYSEALRLLGIRVSKLVMGVVAAIGFIAGMAYLAVTFRLASVMERVKQS